MLNKRIKRCLNKTKRLGYAVIGVHAYIELLDKSSEEGCSYSMNYFSKELIHLQDALIGTLINGPRPQVQALGAQLLASYIRAQSKVENQVTAIDQLMGSVIHLMLGERESSDDGQPSTSSSQAHSRRGTTSDAVKSACMLCIREYIEFCHKLRTIPDQVGWWLGIELNFELL